METTNLLTNISSLKGQLSLSRTETQLNRSIRNLSSGLRLNSPQDAPIDFVSAATFESEISAMSQALAGTQRATNLLSVVDSALGQIHAILNDVRAMVTQAANTGVENTTTLDALQLQLNNSLDAIDRIANSTTFLDKTILDGSLDFQTYALDRSKVTSISVHQANFLGRTEKDVAVKVVEPPRKAELFYQYGALANDATLQLGGTRGYQVFDFAKDATVEMMAQSINTFTNSTGIIAEVRAESSPGQIALTSPGTDNDVIVTASKTGVRNGNFVVKYTAPSEGNSSLDLRFTQSIYGEPNEVEIMLQTSQWKNAAYSYTSTNPTRFSITSRLAGKEFNDVAIEVKRADASARAVGVEGNLTSSPKTLTIYVDDNTTVADVASWVENDSVLRSYFDVQFEIPSDGSGIVLASGSFSQTARGVVGGEVLTTAAEIVQLINTSHELRDSQGNGMLTATLPPNTLGMGRVSPFAEYSYYGNVSDSNYLQFLAPEGTPKIRFVSNAGSKLSVDDTTVPPIYGRTTASIQGLDAGTSFSLRARATGIGYDQAQIILKDSATEGAVYDPMSKTIAISVDFTGRANDPARQEFSIADMKSMIESDPILSRDFVFTPLQNYDALNPPRFANEAYIGINSEVGKFSGGLVEEGMLVVNLETDYNGIIKTTANDLVKFFANPSNVESRAIIEKYGVSVASLNPQHPIDSVCTTGQSSSGTGVLKQTYDPNSCPTPETIRTQYPDVSFTGYSLSPALPTTTILSAGGFHSIFEITATRFDTNLEGVEVLVNGDAAGPRITFDPITKQLSIGIVPGSSITANEIVELINITPDVASLFRASIPQSIQGTSLRPDGNGEVAIGDKGVLHADTEKNAGGAPLVGASDTAGLGLIFRSADYGSEAFVYLQAIQGTNFPVVDRYGNTVERSIGADIIAEINGQIATGRGHFAMTQTSDLSLQIGINANLVAGSVFGFRISGGGALMQLGPDPNSTHQARIALPDIHTAILGSESGRLSDLRLGGIADLFKNTRLGFQIIEDVIEQVAFQRGQLGAFQKNQLDNNINHLTDVIGITEESLSLVRDTDFAYESSLIARNQVLMQANISVLRYPSENARQLLGLLQR